jgi:DnaB helicase-like protein/AAA domain-containing protein/Homeodomain-like domain-containing protein
VNIHQHARAVDEIFGGPLPHNIEAEQCLLGAIFINNKAFAAVDALVNTEDFFEPINQEIFRICGELIRAGKLVSPITVKTFLPTDLKIGNLTISQYLARLAAEATTVINAPDYGKVVRDLANRRHLIAAAEDCAIAAKTATVDVPAEQIAAETIKRINEITTGSGATGSNQALPHIRPLAATEFLKLELPPRQKILAPWLQEKGLVMVYSLRGLGKTLLGMSSAYAIAAGADFLGFSSSGKPRKILYIDGEMPVETMQERLAAIVGGITQQPPADDFFRILISDLCPLGLPDLATLEGQAWIDAQVDKAEVLILDNISTLVRSGKENEAEGWLPVQNWALRHRRAGRAVVMLHHAGKGGAQRGTSRREDVLDTVISLRRPSDYSPDQGARFEVHYEKTRGFYGKDAEPFEVRYEVRDGVAVWTRTEIVDAERARVVAALKDGMSIREAADALGIHRSKVDRLRQKAMEKGELSPASTRAAE